MSETTTRPRLPRILIVDDTPAFHHQVIWGLRKHFEFRSTEKLDEFWTLLAKDNGFDMILLDLALTPDNEDKTLGLEAVKLLREKFPEIPVLVVTNHPDYESATTALQNGAKDYLAKESYAEEKWNDKFLSVIENAQKEMQKPQRKTGNSQNSKPRIFISYAHEDKEYKETFLVRLKALQNHCFDMEIREDSQIQHGHQWQPEIDRLMDGANVFVFLTSKHLFASDFVANIEITTALKAHKEGGALILPILLAPSIWKSTVLAKFQKLPESKEYLSQFQDHDEGWFEVDKVLVDMFKREFPTSVHRS